MKYLTEILEELNQLDETPRLEAKACQDAVGKSFYETVCAFSNEPGLGGGIIVLGVSSAEEDLFGAYEVTGVSDTDKILSDIASGCSTIFNCRIRPQTEVVERDGKAVIIVEIPEASAANKPVFQKSQGLPNGARRRIGSTDQRCDEDDLQVLFTERGGESYDLTPIPTASLLDFDEDAIAHYRGLLEKAGSDGEMLSWEDDELLQSINAVREYQGKWKPTLLGLLLFGKRAAHRRELPMVRIDYIRVPGKTWVEDPEKRFITSYDMRGPIFRLIDRALATVVDDLPKGFELPEDSMQALTPSLPAKALREAIVNAVMHRSYRIDSPIQIIRYSNRIEIINAGFSLKNEDRWLKPGSENRNKNLAAIFHETNTAETKGTGISFMRKKMIETGFSPPTFESSRAENRFSSEFFLHHFLSEDALDWLAQIDTTLSEGQQYALIAVRESHRIDNQTLRQLTGNDILAASSDLRKLCESNMLEKKAAGSATYYIKGDLFPHELSTKVGELPPEVGELDPEVGELDPEVEELMEYLGHLGYQLVDPMTMKAADFNRNDKILPIIPDHLSKAIISLGKRGGSEATPVILALCDIQPLSAAQLAAFLGKKDIGYLKRTHLRPLIDEGKLKYVFEDNENHPQQAYQIPDGNR